MRIQTFVIGYVLALALFVFAKRHTETAPPSTFHAIVDLTTPTGARTAHGRLSPASGTSIIAPSQIASNLWSVDKIPPERLIAPLVVLDVSSSVKKDPSYQVSVQDIANWEKGNGQIPLGSIVMARTGWESQSNVKRGAMRFPGYSEDAAKFLVDGRRILGLGIDTSSIDGGSSQHAVHQYALAHSIYPLQNVANLDRVPSTGAVVVVAPEKIADAASSPVRIFALLK